MSIIIKEVKRLLITLGILNILTILVSYYINYFNFSIIFGLLFADIYIVANFFILGIASFRVVSMNDPLKAKKYMTTNFFIRYIIMGILIFLVLSLEFVNPIAFIVPLLAPKITYYSIGIYSLITRKDIK